MTNFRSLCAELVEALETAIRVIYAEDGTKHISTANPVVDRARAALAQPEPQGSGPTNQELVNVWEDCKHAEPDPSFPKPLIFAHAVLARWGRPAKPEVQDQVLARVEFAEREFNCPSDVVLRQYCDDWFYGDPGRGEVDPVDLCRGAIKLFAQIPAPVPVAERLPGPEDCDAESSCWAYDSYGKWWRVHYRVVKPSSWSHWLPHWALLVPQQEAQP